MTANQVEVTIGPRPVGVSTDAEPVALHVGGTWQILWVANPDDFVVGLFDLGYTVTSNVVEPSSAEPQPRFRLHLVK